MAAPPTMLVRRVLVPSVALLAIACGGGGGGGDDGESQDAILGGAADAKDAAVVELVMGLPGGDEATCTATVIAPKVLLTAAHCVVEERRPHVIPAKATFRVMTARARSVATAKDWIAVRHADVHPHPGYDGEAKHDVAVVVLAQPIGIAPVAIQRTPLSRSVVGAPVRIVGYGQTTRTGGAVETRRAVTTTIRGFEDDLVHIGRTGQQACDGDSGGPAFLTVDGKDVLVATDDISATDANCAQGDLYQRVDLHLGFLQPFLDAP